MGDIIFVLATFAFFAICVAYVNWCDRIIGPDEFGPGDFASDGAADVVLGTGVDAHAEVTA
ncbi:MAG: hypothetical protein JWN39_4048 [Ilumatobacteraceae bacterium]|nr:hypothetical protein [Ilumatobacteraceae bacterium]